jgi:hypothetical protein
MKVSDILKGFDRDIVNYMEKIKAMEDRVEVYKCRVRGMIYMKTHPEEMLEYLRKHNPTKEFTL